MHNRLDEIIIELHDIARESGIPELRKVADDIARIKKEDRLATHEQQQEWLKNVRRTEY